MLTQTLLPYPRPEYPRPERRRGMVEGYDWLNLNGPWQFRFDGERRGIEERWFEQGAAEWREQIIVPFCWESLAAWGEADAAGNDNYYSTRVFRNPVEVNRQNHRSALRYEIGWYRRTSTIPQNDAWKNKRVILTIGAADFYADCWCNGIHLGHHEGGYTPFEFDLTDALIEENGTRTAHLVVRVEDPMDNSEQPVGKQWRWYTTTSGIWQTVFVEPRSASSIESLRIFPDIEAGTARFMIKCENVTKRNCKVAIEISPGSAGTQNALIDINEGTAEKTIKLETLRLWDPNSPFLYDLVLRLKSGAEDLDVINSYFGMRKIDFEYATAAGVPAAIRINNLPRYLRGALHQSFYPDGVYTASSVEVIKNDLAAAKRFGFNFLRIHIKIDDPLLYYWADKTGMLLMADFPNFGEGGDTPLGRKRFEAMMREGIERDFNHPSIFAWCLFNETWGFGGQDTFSDKLLPPPPGAELQGDGSGNGHPIKKEKPVQMPAKEWVQDMWELAKQLDPTRLVEDMSVVHWEHLEYYLHCDTDINSWHFYISDYEKARTHIEKIVKSTFLGSSFNYVPGFLHKGQPLINSEFGGVGALDGDRDVSWSFKFLTNELRRHQQIAAYIYTELHDVEWEYNGMLNYDRTPKEFGYDPRIINESNSLPVDSPPVRRLHPGERVRIEVSSSHYSTKRHTDVSLHWTLGGIDDRGRIHKDIIRGSSPIPFPHRQVAPAHKVEFEAPGFPLLATLLIVAKTRRGEVVAQNFIHYFISPGYPPEREEINRALVLRGTPSSWSAAEWSAGSAEREKERAEDACYGVGHGYFEWDLHLNGADLTKARRLKILCEASSHRADFPQTDDDVFPTTLDISLNDTRLYHGVLRNHPHDSRGVLSYWRGGVGAYGYLIHATAEGETLQKVIGGAHNGSLKLRCSVPADALAQGGLTIYGAECGRFPLCPTVIIEW
jgi:hypothetical protein